MKNILKFITVIAFVIATIFCIYYWINSVKYEKVKNFMAQKNWSAAMNILPSISDGYKDVKSLELEVHYNYFKLRADENYEKKNLSSALDNYNLAKNGFNDDEILEKIKIVNNEIEIKAKEKLEQIENEKKEKIKQIEKEKHADEEKIKNLQKRMDKEYDKVENITWYYPNVYYNTRSRVFLYLGNKKDISWLRFRLIYIGSDWVFFDKIIFNIDGKRSVINISSFDKTTDVNNGSVFEGIDLDYITHKELINEIIHSKSTIVRFSGKYNSDMTISSSQKNAMKDMVELLKLKNKIYEE